MLLILGFTNSLWCLRSVGVHNLKKGTSLIPILFSCISSLLMSTLKQLLFWGLNHTYLLCISSMTSPSTITPILVHFCPLKDSPFFQAHLPNVIPILYGCQLALTTPQTYLRSQLSHLILQSCLLSKKFPLLYEKVYILLIVLLHLILL